ncbi:hypothetical protein HS088_TW02G00358 [Tripterygium wilfordii]|uniref:Uncharacterized protein n=1 Tax=Tripterygium wilfordii TaxID=458696 RepID=A0A7J7DYA0_TRIWF|nr:hypothetical protein HS088_TW02G00358 [Tripterygium wilfordii]
MKEEGTSLAAMAPFISRKQEDEEGLHHYKLHGEIMMLIIIVMFSVFLVFLVMVPCVRRCRDPESGHAEYIFNKRLWFPWKAKRNDDEDASEVSVLQFKSRSTSQELPIRQIP